MIKKKETKDWKLWRKSETTSLWIKVWKNEQQYLKNIYIERQKERKIKIETERKPVNNEEKFNVKELE